MKDMGNYKENELTIDIIWSPTAPTLLYLSLPPGSNVRIELGEVAKLKHLEVDELGQPECLLQC